MIAISHAGGRTALDSAKHGVTSTGMQAHRPAPAPRPNATKLDAHSTSAGIQTPSQLVVSKKCIHPWKVRYRMHACMHLDPLSTGHVPLSPSHGQHVP